jgi:hypothetical protein
LPQYFLYVYIKISAEFRIFELPDWLDLVLRFTKSIDLHDNRELHVTTSIESCLYKKNRGILSAFSRFTISWISGGDPRFRDVVGTEAYRVCRWLSLLYRGQVHTFQ